MSSMATLYSFSWHALATLLFFIVQLNGALSMKVFTSSTLPTDVTAACAGALTSDVACSPVITALQNGYYYAQNVLETICTAECNSALGAYEASVGSACAGQTWDGYFDEVMPIVMVADLLRYQFNQTCLMDSGRYCNVVAAQAATAQDPSEPLGGGAVGGGDVTDCDLCFIKKLQFLAGSPYYDGPLLVSDYSSKTSSCSVTDYPLTTSTLDFFPTTSIASSTPTPCPGQTYTIQPSDDCKSISKSQTIGTSWLLTDNSLAAYCADFPTDGTLCLANTCQTYTVKQDDTCDSISKANGITTTQLLAWNPVINAGCNNLDKAIGYEICVGQPGTEYNPPTTSFPAITSVSTPAPAPTDLAEGTNTNCGRYYKAITGDYCNLLVIKFSISLSDFIFLNPEINVNCTNLYADESYCVQAVGDINTYSGRPGFSTPTVAVPSSTFTSFPDATYVPIPKNNTLLPFADKTRTDCNWYINGGDFQEDWSGSIFISNCDAVAALYGATLDELGYWNPSLGDTSLSNCTFNPAYQYCALWSASPSSPPEDSNPVLPIRDGASPDCTEYYPVPGRMTCQEVLDAQSLTIAQFFAYNPAVGADCSGLWPNYQYCVRTPDYVDETPTTTSSGTITSVPTSSGSGTGPTAPSAPTQTGQPANCNKWYTAVSGDSCGSIESAYLLSDSDFHAWNPAISADCSSGLWADYAYCVGTTASTSPPPTTSVSATTTSSAPALPSPTQDNSIVSNCNKYAQAQSGDYCYIFAENNGISTTDLYAWNAVLGSDGSGCGSSFWSGYYYCVGVSS